MKHVLVVEDDPDIQALLEIHLSDLECEVVQAIDGQRGFQLVTERVFDLVILDVMLPGMDGLEFCRRMRANQLTTPVLMLTAKSEEIDKVLGLETGADDYLTKPFSVREFIARVKALFRRAAFRQEVAAEVGKEVLKLDGGKLTIELEKYKVLIDGARVELTPKEYDLLVLMAKHPGRSYSREQLLNLVWGYEFSGYEHTVNSHINRLRTKIEPDFSKPRYILTTWGVGYRFNDDLD